MSARSSKSDLRQVHLSWVRKLSGPALVLAIALPAQGQLSSSDCQRTLRARVVALDQPFVWNRLGAAQPQGMIFALRRDVVEADSGLTEEEGGVLSPGGVRLRDDKRTRPLVLRMNVGDCLAVEFQNLLQPLSPSLPGGQPHTRKASMHGIGLQLVDSILSDGSNVGKNQSSLVDTGGTITYTWFAEREGQHVLYSTGANVGGEGDGGQINPGLFGMVNVEPEGSRWFRSQLTPDELKLALHVGHPNEDPDNPGHTFGGHPIIDYGRTYPDSHRYHDLPILAFLNGNEIVHSDLTAIITSIAAGTYPPNPVYPDRDRSFREFTIIYHDEIGAKQAFDIFERDDFEHTLHSVRDAFAINYGTGGIGAEILANRFGVGPMWDCTECKYEEFFLTSWAVGDPAMIVDEPANSEDANGNLILGPKATEAFFPDDPSNVYHSYLQDHTKFRIGHAGSKEHHVHHQHTHQWLFSPDSDESAYLDSQTLGPGASFTLEMTYHGSGNRNQAVGDSIFHCHFYPHFAQGMWALWRVHDVFEDGSRKLPDGEIVQGTPIPVVVPIPGQPMAPMPQAQVRIVPEDFDGDGNPDSGQVEVKPLPNQTEIGNPGYPFWVPGKAGHRPPHPPLDTLHDGGLPRHVVVSAVGSDAIHVETPLDFTKRALKLAGKELAETGEKVELAAMAFHATRHHDTYRPDGTPALGTAGFVANGRPQVRGAPYADPCIDDDGNPIGVNADGSPKRKYKAADIQIDAIFNKTGWHFPQMRMSALWEDVAAFFSGARPPEPLFFRANSVECIEFQLVNLVPHEYEFDDFQVRTPTDILGQHIHLVKFDVLASDGAANGWNYEDGSFSPDEVRERIEAFNDFDGPNNTTSGFMALDGTFPLLDWKPHPQFGSGPHGKFEGAQTTVQRWMADDVLNLNGKDRTLRTVFTHDHFGPSTHQQAGLYAGLVVEPAGSLWFDPDSGDQMGGRPDGGPTSWRADIVTPNEADSYREFMLEFADFQLAYRAGSHPELKSGGGPIFPPEWNNAARNFGEGFDRPDFAINPAGRKEIGLPFLLGPPDVTMPEAVSADDVGTMSVNYRNEPVALRVHDPDDNGQADGIAGDLSHVFRSELGLDPAGNPILRARSELNLPPSQWPYSNGAGPPAGSASVGAEQGDPFTPLLRAYETDRMQMRILIGAHEEGHNFSLQGHKWHFEPSWKDSGWRNSQIMGISEHFEVLAKADHLKGDRKFVDYLYEMGSSTDDLWNGIWGLLRVYDGSKSPDTSLLALPNNPDAKAPDFGNSASFNGPCPNTAPARPYVVHAVRAKDVLPAGTLHYNPRNGFKGPLNDPTALLFVPTSHLALEYDADGNVVGAHLNLHKVDPLVLRAAAGDCISLTLVNHLTGAPHDLDGFMTLPMLIENFNANQIDPSLEVGLHAQLVDYLVTQSDGTNVGFNPVQTASPQKFDEFQNLDTSKMAFYRWYAGDLYIHPDGNRSGVPIEFGSVNLTSSDRIKHASKGAIGGLIVEPEDAWWADADEHATSATIYSSFSPASSFREFVTLFQSDVNMRHGDGSPVPLLDGTADPEDSGHKAVNYSTEPMWFRMGFPPDLGLDKKEEKDFSNSLSNGQIGGDPFTPVFRVAVGTPTRFRVLKPAGNQRNHVFQVHGHVWEILPFTHDPSDPLEALLGSTRLGVNARSTWEGATMGIGPSSHHNVLVKNGAGGRFGVVGDYLWRDHQSFMFDGGLWGLMRVE